MAGRRSVRLDRWIVNMTHTRAVRATRQWWNAPRQVEREMAQKDVAHALVGARDAVHQQELSRKGVARNVVLQPGEDQGARRRQRTRHCCSCASIRWCNTSAARSAAAAAAAAAATTATTTTSSSSTTTTTTTTTFPDADVANITAATAAAACDAAVRTTSAGSARNLAMPQGTGVQLRHVHSLREGERRTASPLEDRQCHGRDQRMMLRERQFACKQRVHTRHAQAVELAGLRAPQKAKAEDTSSSGMDVINRIAVLIRCTVASYNGPLRCPFPPTNNTQHAHALPGRRRTAPRVGS